MVVEQIPKVVGFLYALALFVAGAWLLYSGRWTKRIGSLLLAVTIAFGFLILSPIMPYMIEILLTGNTAALGVPPLVPVAGITLMLLLSLLFGRFYCGYLCPAGAVQEVAYLAPVPKMVIKQKALQTAVRLLVLAAVLVAAFAFSFSLLSLFGIADFFLLTVSAASAIFAGIVLLSLVLYRPFCRFACPFGAIVQGPAAASALKIRRTDACIDCGRCEKACPTDEAKRDDAKGECYLCGRCLDVCPVAGALRYGRK